MFSFTMQHLVTPALKLDYHLTPWDEPILGAPTAAIATIGVYIPQQATVDFIAFRAWCLQGGIQLVCCRLAQDRLDECGFLETQGFRFIELNYRPTVSGLARFQADPDIAILPATMADIDEIVGFAAQIYDAGRLHADPQVGVGLGNRRYAAWARNAFNNPRQSVLKCEMDGGTVGFFVVEAPDPASRFWSLIGLAPGMSGRGLGRRVWQSMLAHHHEEGVAQVSTSISSHNVAVHNLYVALGFRFPSPEITLHWCPTGPLNRPTS